MSSEAATTSRIDRSYELLEDEPRPEGIRRIAAGRADSALEQLRETADGDPAKAIHEARKDLKKLRSVLRLVREQVGDDLYDRENQRFREAGRRLSDARDAEARLEAVGVLREAGGDAFPATTAERWVASLEQRRRRLLEEASVAELERVIAMISEGRQRIAEWPLDGDSYELVAPGLERAYRRGRKRFPAVLAEPTDRRVHEWRKRVKDLWYMQRLLTPLWPAVLEALAEAAHELSSLLGAHHDLAVLIADARAVPDLFDGDGLAELLELCHRRQAELLAASLPLGRRIYAEKPKRFADRLSVYWEFPARRVGADSALG